MEMVAHELAAFPGVAECKACVDGHVVHVVRSENSAESYECPDAMRGFKTPSMGCGNGCPSDVQEDWLTLGLRTTRRQYGAIHLRVDDEEAIAPYVAFAGNTANLVALHVENARTTTEFNALNRDLDRQVKERTRQLRESQKRLSEAQRVARIGSFESDNDGNIVWWSDHLYHLFGVNPAQFTPTREAFLALLHPDDVDETRRAINRCVTTGRVIQSEYRARYSDGSWRHFESIASPMRDRNGQIIGLRGSIQDITDRRETEQSLRESNQRFSQMSEYIDDILWLFDVEDPDNIRLLFMSSAYERTMQRPLAEVYEAPFAWTASIHPDDRERVVTAFGDFVRGKGQLVYEYRTVKSDGSIGTLNTHGTLIRNEQGKIIRAAGITRDVTERKQNEQSLRESNQRFSQISDYIDDIFWLFDVEDPENAKALYVSTAYERVFHRPVEDVYQDASVWYEYVHPEDKERVVAAFQNFLQGHGDIDHELRSVRPNNSVRTVVTRGNLIRNKDGKVIRAAGITRDVTDRKLQEALQAGQNLVLQRMLAGESLESVLNTLVQTLEQQTDGMKGSILVLQNEDQPRLFGGAAPSLPKAYCDQIEGVAIGPSVGSCGTAAYRNERVVVEDIESDPLWANYHELALQNGLRACWSQPITNSEGEVLGTFALYYHKPRRPTERELNLIDSFAHLAALAIERVQAEEALRKGEKENRALVENAPYCIHQIDTQGRIISMNSAGIMMMGAACEHDVLGLRYLDAVAKEDQARVQEQLRAALNGHSSEFEFNADNGLAFASSFVPIFDDDGRVVRIMGITQDVTERKRAEKKRLDLEAQLRQSQKMEAVGQLAGGVAHDFNNLLTAILGNAEVLLHVLGESPQSELIEQLKSGVGEIQSAGNHAASLTRQLLAFSRREVLRPELIDPLVTVNEMKALLRRLIGEHIELEVKLDPQTSLIHADSGQVEQVVMNLIVNAVDAMPDGGRLDIELCDIELDKSAAPEFEDARPGRYVQLSVSDNGTGMNPETLEHVFEPFFTTKPIGKGTGLGLSTVYGILKQSSGFVRVESEIDGGTTFKICFPAINRTNRLNPSDCTPEFGAADASILVCEDEGMVRNVMCKALIAAGFSVIETENGAKALEAADQHGGPIDLLITDVVMPGISGSELAGKLIQKHPNARVLFVSGYSADHLDAQGIECGATQLLQKPFGPSALIDRVKMLIGAERNTP
jgi:PAS domain S-box-containing protein